VNPVARQTTYRRRERGAIDLMQAVVAFLMITVAVVGTTYAMFYGRQALIRQEHRKVALYQLRQYVEHWTSRITLGASGISARDMLGGPDTAVYVDLDDPSVPDGVEAVIVRGCTEAVDLPETGVNVDYYRIHFSATWQERDGTEQRIDLNTSVVGFD